MTADIAHELRTPLHIIQGNLEGILDGIYEPADEHITATLEETHLLARLVDDLQTLALAEAGELELVREPLDPVELLEDVRTSFSGQAEAAGIDLRLEIDPLPGPPAVTADVGRIDQVLGNLVINALRHTPQGGTITLSAGPIQGGLHFQVADTGEGIAADELPYIFDRFWRGDPSRPHGSGSLGLGLAIAQQLVEAHGGRIEVESEAGRGTTFTVELYHDGDSIPD
jgi:two-component system sensor histidine kinase BaeS